MNYQDEQNRDEQGSALENENQHPIGDQADDMMEDNINQRDEMLDDEEPMGDETENIGLGEDETDSDDEADDLTEDEDLDDLDDDDMDDVDEDRRDGTII